MNWHQNGTLLSRWTRGLKNGLTTCFSSCLVFKCLLANFLLYATRDKWHPKHLTKRELFQSRSLSLLLRIKRTPSNFIKELFHIFLKSFELYTKWPLQGTSCDENIQSARMNDALWNNCTVLCKSVVHHCNSNQILSAGWFPTSNISFLLHWRLYWIDLDKNACTKPCSMKHDCV